MFDRGAPRDSPFPIFLSRACDQKVAGRTGEASRRQTDGEERIHLLLLDPFPPGRRGPNGIHSAIWEQFIDEPFELDPEKPLTMVAYDADLCTRAYIETVAVGDALPEMPLFLAPELYVMVPLEVTYQSAWDTVPARWQRVIASAN